MSGKNKLFLDGRPQDRGKVILDGKSVSGDQLPTEGLIAHYEGGVDTIGVSSYLLSSYPPGAKHTGQFKGRAIQGDGGGYGTFAQPVVLSGDFKIQFAYSLNGSLDANNSYILGNDATFIDSVKSTSTGKVELNIGGTFYSTPLDITTEQAVYEIERVGSTVYFRRGDVEEVKTSVSTADLTVNNIHRGAHSNSVGNLSDLKFFQGSTLIADLPMINYGQPVEYDWSDNDNHVTWSGFSGEPYAELTDGRGSNRLNEKAGYSESENRLVHSNNFEDASWSKGSVSVSDNTITISSAFHLMQQAVAVAPGEQLYLHFMAQGGTAADVHYSIYDRTNAADIIPTTSFISEINQESYSLITVPFTVPAGCTEVGVYPLRNGLQLGTVMIKDAVVSDSPVYRYAETVDQPITGIQPPSFQNLPATHPGPIAADMQIKNMVCLQGDGSGYIETPLGEGDLTGGFTVEMTYVPAALDLGIYLRLVGGPDTGSLRTSGSTEWNYLTAGEVGYWRINESELSVGVPSKLKLSAINSGGITTYLIEHNGVEVASGTRSQADLTPDELWFMHYNGQTQASGKIYNIKAWNSNGDPILTFPFEDGHPDTYPNVTTVQDVVGGNDGTLMGFSGSPWSTRDEGDTALRHGFSVDRVIGDELWVNPTTQTTDANNYSTFDPETGIGRIVSDGTFVQLNLSAALVSGFSYLVEYTEIDKVSGALKGQSFTNQSNPGEYTFNNGSEIGVFVADSTLLNMARNGACDVTFRLSVKEIQPGYSLVNPATGLHQDGSAPQYAKDSMELVNNLPSNISGALGPKMQGLTEWTGEATNHIGSLPFNTNNMTFKGANGIAIYSEAQTAESIAIIQKQIG